MPPMKRSETFGYALEYITAVLLEQIVKPPAGSTPEQVARTQMLLMLLPRLLLCYPAKYDPRERSLNNVLLGRINDFLDLQFDKLFQEAADSCGEFRDKQASYAWLTPSEIEAQNDVTIKKHAKINFEVAQGNVSKAATIAFSECHYKSMNEPEVMQQVKQLFKSERDATLDATTLDAPLTKYLTPKDIEVALANSRKTGAGPSGWSFDLMKIVARRKTGKVLLASFLTGLLENKYPGEMMTALCCGSLTVLSKPNSTGVRPIVVSDAFMRLLAKAIIIREQRYLGQHLAPLQAGVGLRGGIEFVIHSVRQLLHSHDKNWACISIDCKNAYGSILLKVIQNALKRVQHGRADLVSAYFDNFVSRRRILKTPGATSDEDLIEVADGIIQGDPLSPLYFCMAMQPILDTVQSMLKDGHVFGYLDDIVLVGPIGSVFPAYGLFRSMAADIGLEVNAAKTKVLSLYAHLEGSLNAAPVPGQQQVQQQQQQQQAEQQDHQADVAAPEDAYLQQSLTKFCSDDGLGDPYNCITLLGSPVGVPSEEAKEAIKYVNSIPFNKLKELQSHQVRFALLQDTMSQTVKHLARTVPPSCVKPAFAIFDNKILDVVRTCLEAMPEEIDSITRKEIGLPRTNGGFGLPELKNGCELAYFSSVFNVVQTWLLYKKADAPLLQSWIQDPDDFVTPLPQKLSNFNIVKELKSCLQKSHHIASQAVQAKSAKPDKANKTSGGDAGSKSKPKTSKSKAPPDSTTTPSSSVIQHSFALSILPANLPGMLVIQKKRSLQPILMKCKAAVDVHEFYTQCLTTNEERAQFNSKRGVGASAFLRALPSEPGLTFDNKNFMLALRLHLRLPVLHKFGIKAGVPCCCNHENSNGKDMRLTEGHLLNCHAFNVMNDRHEALKNVFVSLLRFCKLVPGFEDLAGPGTGRINRWDVTADRYNQHNQDLKVDVTVTNPATRHMAPRAAFKQGAAALKARNKKNKKYKSFLKPSDDFFPLVFETFGYIDTPVLGLLCTLAERVNNVPPETATWTAPTFKSYAVQRLSCCLWKENAKAVNTIISSTVSKFEYESYNSAGYEDRNMPQFELSPADFPPLISNIKNKVTFVTLAEKTAAVIATTASAAVAASKSHALPVPATTAAVRAPRASVTTTAVAPSATSVTGSSRIVDFDPNDLVNLAFADDNGGDDVDFDDSDLVPVNLVTTPESASSMIPVGMTNPVPTDATLSTSTSTLTRE